MDVCAVYLCFIPAHYHTVIAILRNPVLVSTIWVAQFP
jgi:hypothetical protein